MGESGRDAGRLDVFASSSSVMASAGERCRVVVYERTNKVKQALAYARGRALRATCGYNNKRDDAKCVLPLPYRVDVVVLRSDLLESMAKDTACREAVARVDPARVLRMTYEALLADAPRELARLFEWLGLSELWTRHTRGDRSASAHAAAAYSKATPDDLRTVLSNFDEVDRWLAANASCLVPHLRATDPSAEQPVDCDIYAHEIQERLHESATWKNARENKVTPLAEGAPVQGWKHSRKTTGKKDRGREHRHSKLS